MIVLVKSFNLIPNMPCFEPFFKLTSFYQHDLLWPWPLTYLGIVHLGYNPKFLCTVNEYHHAKFHAFFRLWTILIVLGNNQAHYNTCLTFKWPLVTYNSIGKIFSLQKWTLLKNSIFHALHVLRFVKYKLLCKRSPSWILKFPGKPVRV